MQEWRIPLQQNEKRLVGVGKVFLQEFVDGEPAEGIVVVSDVFRLCAAEPEAEIDGSVVVDEFPLEQQADGFDVEAGFFFTLTNGCGLGRFVRFDFAAGEFRFAGECAAGSAASDEVASLVLDDGDANPDGLGAHVAAS